MDLQSIALATWPRRLNNRRVRSLPDESFIQIRKTLTSGQLGLIVPLTRIVPIVRVSSSKADGRLEPEFSGRDFFPAMRDWLLPL